MPAKPRAFWFIVVHRTYGYFQECSRHRTETAANAAAQECEAAGGTRHEIWKARRLTRTRRKRGR